MVRVIGKLGCSNCEITKQILKKKGIKFEYELMSNLPEEEQDALFSLAELKGYTEMPLIFNDDQLVNIAQLQ